MKQIENEMNANKGWLKPKRLKELAGTQAMEVEAENIKEERRRKKRARYLKKYRARMKKMAKPFVVKFSWNK